MKLRFILILILTLCLQGSARASETCKDLLLKINKYTALQINTEPYEMKAERRNAQEISSDSSTTPKVSLIKTLIGKVKSIYFRHLEKNITKRFKELSTGEATPEKHLRFNKAIAKYLNSIGVHAETNGYYFVHFDEKRFKDSAYPNSWAAQVSQLLAYRSTYTQSFNILETLRLDSRLALSGADGYEAGGDGEGAGLRITEYDSFTRDTVGSTAIPHELWHWMQSQLRKQEKPGFYWPYHFMKLEIPDQMDDLGIARGPVNSFVTYAIKEIYKSFAVEETGAYQFEAFLKLHSAEGAYEILKTLPKDSEEAKDERVEIKSHLLGAYTEFIFSKAFFKLSQRAYEKAIAYLSDEKNFASLPVQLTQEKSLLKLSLPDEKLSISFRAKEGAAETFQEYLANPKLLLDLLSEEKKKQEDWFTGSRTSRLDFYDKALTVLRELDPADMIKLHSESKSLEFSLGQAIEHLQSLKTAEEAQLNP